MYFFVRFTGIVILIVGALLMLLGVGTTIYGFVQNEALVDLVNNYWLASSNSRLIDARFYAAVTGLALFLAGMLTAAMGQLMLVFADVASNTKETNAILRGMRKTE
jgi:cbb3-type cytochrome oxidase subunit 1